MKIALVVAPLVGLALYVLVRALRGRPLSRFSLNVVVALFLLGYLATTAALGIFWVARMDLPVFDWHYLFGYAVVLLATVHVALQLPKLGAFFRRGLKLRLHPTALPTSVQKRRRAAIVVLIAVATGVVAWLLGRRQRKSAKLLPPPDSSSRTPVEPLVERAGVRVEIARYLYEESSYSRAGILRSVGLAPPRPPDVKAYEGSPRWALPRPRSSAEFAFSRALAEFSSAAFRHASEPAPPRAVGLQEIADLAHYAAGATSAEPSRSGTLFRAAASSGALYPTDLYLLIRRASGVEPGAYYYDVRAHALVRVGGVEVADDVARACTLTRAFESAPLALVLGATYDRTVSKYDIRSYRYLALDAGHLGANAVLAAHALGLRPTLEPWFDDARLLAALELDPREEAPLFAVALGATSSPKRSDRPARQFPRVPEDLATAELTRLSHALTAWRLLGPSSPGEAGSDSRPRELPPLERRPGTLPLPKAHASGDLFELVARRRSFRAYEPDAVTLDDLSGIVVDAATALIAVRGGELVELFVVARAVAGLEPGAYRYDRERQALEPLARGDFSHEIERGGLDQELLGRAAVVLVWSLAPERLGQLDGARDFREAGIATGIAGECAYLAATARELGICGVGAFYDEEVAALIGDGSAALPLYLQAVGRKSS